MKTTTPAAVLAPRLPKQLPPRAPQRPMEQFVFEGGLFTNWDWIGQTAAGIRFEQALIRRAVFSGATLPQFRLIDARVEVSDLSNTICDRPRFQRVEFSECRLLGAQWPECRLEDVVFRECDLRDAVLVLARCRAVRFEQCNLTGATLLEADLTGVVFAGCDLTDVVFHGARMAGADLRGSILNNARAGAAELKGVIIDAAQAAQVVTLFGVVVRDANADTSTAHDA
ncbi:MAG: pentapeptide repeat-containing protein [Chloroflexi bacterium]|nr:pentapeptide repeat-containing protein [Chloroflexota bacterium]